MTKEWLSIHNYLDPELQEELFYTGLKANANAAINFFQQEARRELRYTFRGKIVPIEIENLLKYVLKKSLAPEKISLFHDTQINQKFDIIDFEKTTKEDGKPLYLIKALIQWSGKTITFWVKETFDRKWWQYPIREIHYNDKVYREIPRHGNVFSHTKYQQEHIEKSTDIDYYHEKITLPEKRMMDAVHPIHDIDEIKNGDIEDTKKTSTDYISNGALLEILQETNPKNKQTEYYHTVLHSMMQRIDGPYSIFKAYERIQYFKNAIDIYNTAEYYNHKEHLSGDIFSNYMHIFAKNEAGIYIPYSGSQQDIERHIPIAHKPLSFPSIRAFFMNHGKEVTEIFQWVIRKRKDFHRKWLATKSIEQWYDAWKVVQQRLKKKNFD